MFTLPPTKLREHHRSLTTIKAAGTGWLLRPVPDQQVALCHRGAKTWSRSLVVKETFPAAKKSCSRQHSQRNGGRARRLPAAAAVNNSCCRHRRNIASGSHRHADP